MKNIIEKFAMTGMFLCAMMLNTPQVNAQIIHSESFDSVMFPPTGWVITGGANSQWVRRTTGTNPVCMVHSGAAMARFTSFMQQPGSTEQMSTPVIDWSGASGTVPHFSLWVYRDNSSTAGDSVSILVNTTNSLTGAVRIGGVARSRFFVLPTNEPANGWYNYTFNVPTSFNTNTNYIILNGVAHGGGNVYIDDVQWTEYPFACASPLAAGNVISNDTILCNGGGSANLALNGSSITLGGLTFQWQSGPGSTGPWTNFGTSASTANSGNLTATTYFRCYIDCSNGSVSDTSSVLTVVVNPNPNPVVAVTPTTAIICSGAAPVLLAASGAYTYTWTPAVTTNGVGDSAYASPATTTVYNITGVDSFGCPGYATASITVNPTPTVLATAGNDTICSGQPAALHATVAGGGFGINFQWQPGGLSGANVTVNPGTTTTYTVTATANSSGCSASDSIQIVVYPSPVAGFTYTSTNLTYTFTDTSSGGTLTYLWNFGDLTTDIVQNPVHTYANSGNYTVTLTVSNGNCSTTFTQTILVVSVNNLLADGSEVVVYPNPVSNIATVRFS